MFAPLMDTWSCVLLLVFKAKKGLFYHTHVICYICVHTLVVCGENVECLRCLNV
jgi:hypothetical protein